MDLDQSHDHPVALLKQEIYSNWLKEEGVCGGSDEEGELCKLCGQEPPDFGAYSFDANLMLVNNTPGFGQGDGRKRGKVKPKNGGHEYSEDVFKRYQNTIEDFDSNSIDFPYTYCIENEWSFLKNLKRHVIEADYNGTSLDVEIKRDCYYTNSLKCPKTENSELNSSARERCQEYLKKEIDLVAPKVILTGGPKATQTTINALDWPYQVPDTFTRFIDSADDYAGNANMKHGSYGDSPLLIPTYQFGMLQSNWYHPSWISDNKEERKNQEYFKPLIECISSGL